jgi:hypothetical protein
MPFPKGHLHLTPSNNINLEFSRSPPAKLLNIYQGFSRCFGQDLCSGGKSLVLDLFAAQLSLLKLGNDRFASWTDIWQVSCALDSHEVENFPPNFIFRLFWHGRRCAGAGFWLECILRNSEHLISPDKPLPTSLWSTTSRNVRQGNLRAGRPLWVSWDITATSMKDLCIHLLLPLTLLLCLWNFASTAQKNFLSRKPTRNCGRGINTAAHSDDVIQSSGDQDFALDFVQWESTENSLPAVDQPDLLSRTFIASLNLPLRSDLPKLLHNVLNKCLTACLHEIIQDPSSDYGRKLIFMLTEGIFTISTSQQNCYSFSLNQQL